MRARSLMGTIIRKVKGFLIVEDDPRLSLLKKMPRSAVCAEIGVWKGDFSMCIQNLTSPKKLHLIDPWMLQNEFPERMYGGSVAQNQEDMDRIYEGVRMKFNSHQNVIFHRGMSEEVLSEFEGAYFDWVYIDGNHYYEYVLKDLRTCLLKVKKGGVIAGDDYEWGEKEGYPVKRAVHNFIEENNLESNIEVLGSQFIIRL